MRMLSLLCLLLLAACNGESGSESSPDNKFSGFWSTEKSDGYLEIKESGDVLLRTCSLNDGYTAEEGISYKLAGNKLSTMMEGFTFSGTLELKKEGKQLVLSYDKDIVLPPGHTLQSEAVLLTKQDTIPDFCDGDAIEITYYSPKEAIEGELTTFTVDFSYRLSSSDKATIEVGFTRKDHTTLLDNKKIELSSKGLGSDSFVVESVPLVIGSGVPYSMSILMEVNPSSSESTYYITEAKKVIKVLPNSSSSGVETHIGIEKQLKAHTLGLFK